MIFHSDLRHTLPYFWLCPQSLLKQAGWINRPNGAALSGVIRFFYTARIAPLAYARGSVPSLLSESNASHSRE
ncbi:hypothetical protein Lwal_2301 [Legionella waltersii]|uniref:Uncharacterized protein n=1 Tax=Legionella waltersii TaxID=66969 RepID=A0A0W1A6G0_9GAMM|nr:hypothetical protein Lwal_2301 [Legionella waltersii]SNU94449.1 Uncharacterised protein [Legionella waltersii]